MWPTVVARAGFRPLSQRTGPGFRRRHLLPVLAGAALICLLAPGAGAQEAERRPSVARLQFEYRCYFDASGWPDHPTVEKQFKDRLVIQLDVRRKEAPAEVPAVEAILARVIAKMARDLEARGDARAANALAKDILSLTAAPAELVDYAQALNDRVGLQDMRQYMKDGLNAEASDMAVGLLHSRQPAIVEEAARAMVTVSVKRSGYDAVKGQDLAAEGQLLLDMGNSIEAALTAGFPDGPPASVRDCVDQAWSTYKKRADEIERSTQKIGFAKRDASRAFGAKFAGEAKAVDFTKVRVTLTPVPGEDKEKLWQSRNGMPEVQLFMRGTYDITFHLPGEAEPWAVWAKVVLDAKRIDLSVPDRAVKGMVYVGSWTGADGSKHGGFYMDRLERTVADVKAAAGRDASITPFLDEQDDGPGVPGSFREVDEGAGMARKVADALGMKIPTVEQWRDAFRGPWSPEERPYPWGRTAPSAETAALGLVERSLVGQRPKGASPYGIQDMVGNMAELVVHRGNLWTIGGNFSRAPEGLKVSVKNAAGGTETRNRLEDPAPTKAAFDALTDVNEKNLYGQYLASYEDFYTIGLRLVVPLD